MHQAQKNATGHALYVTPESPELRRAAAHLVLKFFPESPPALLGEKFLTEFYFGDLVRDGELECLLYEVQDRYAGIIVATKNPFHFIGHGVRRHFLKLSWLVGLSLLAKPRRVLAILDVVRQGRHRVAKERKNVAEILTMAVDPDFRDHANPETGMPIPHHMLSMSLNKFRREGYSSVQFKVLKANLRVQAFVKKFDAVVDPEGYCFDDTLQMEFNFEKKAGGQ